MAADGGEGALLPYVPDTLQVPELAVLNVVKPPLPVLGHRKEVVRSVRENKVTILSGETGSGKSTQVPQFLLEEADLVPEGMRIVVTQPRRIACITLAERVAHERGEAVGQTVGYQIRFVNNTSPSTRLVFCTTAVLLRQLHSDPCFDSVAVLCVDEVHERDVQTEFLLTAVRERLRQGEMSLRLVLMSATLQTDTFVSFFEGLRGSWLGSLPPDPDPRSCITVEGRMFPVKELFLEDALEWTGHRLVGSAHAKPKAVDAVLSRLAGARTQRAYSQETLRSLAVYSPKEVYLDLMVDLIRLFHKTSSRLGDKNKSGILVFLPGWADIASMQAKLHGEPGLWTLPLHSQISPEQQQSVFLDPPAGYRKVVLSTNVAETSVTIDDIVYVINSGVMKESVFDADRQLGALEVTLNTWANATQRAGRVGRTQEGVVVHIFPRWLMKELTKWPVPEMLSKSLEEVVLQLIALGLGDPHDVLAKSLSQPSVEAIEHAVWLLQEMGMVQDRQGLRAGDALLPLGRWLAPIPLHPMSAKALLYASLFGVLLPVAAMVAFLNLKSPFPQLDSGDKVRGGSKAAFCRGRASDHFATAAVYLDWRAQAAAGVGDAFVEEHGLSHETLEMGDQLVKSLLRLMTEEYEYDGDDACFADDADTGTWTSEAVFDDPRTWTLCKAALCAGFSPLFARCGAGRFESNCNEDLHGHSSSVNAGYRPVGNPYTSSSSLDDWVVYTDMMKLGRVSILESTAVSASYPLLFSRVLRPTSDAKQPGQIDFDGWRGNLSGGDQALAALQRARRWLSDQVERALETQSAGRLPESHLNRIAATLGHRSLAVKGVRGTKQLRIGAKEASTIWLGNLPDEVDQEDVEALFATCGAVYEVSLPTDRETGRRRGFGYVTMKSREEAQCAFQELNGVQMQNRRLRLELKGIQGTAIGHTSKWGRAAAKVDVVCGEQQPRNRWIQPPTKQDVNEIRSTFRVMAEQKSSRLSYRTRRQPTEASGRGALAGRAGERRARRRGGGRARAGRYGRPGSSGRAAPGARNDSSSRAAAQRTLEPHVEAVRNSAGAGRGRPGAGGEWKVSDPGARRGPLYLRPKVAKKRRLDFSALALWLPRRRTAAAPPHWSSGPGPAPWPRRAGPRPPRSARWCRSSRPWRGRRALRARGPRTWRRKRRRPTRTPRTTPAAPRPRWSPRGTRQSWRRQAPQSRCGGGRTKSFGERRRETPAPRTAQAAAAFPSRPPAAVPLRLRGCGPAAPRPWADLAARRPQTRRRSRTRGARRASRRAAAARAPPRRRREQPAHRAATGSRPSGSPRCPSRSSGSTPGAPPGSASMRSGARAIRPRWRRRPRRPGRPGSPRGRAHSPRRRRRQRGPRRRPRRAPGRRGPAASCARC
ncbi:unnamed protein product [Prorocentrum cordatum]|uniref:RNA helicase n=1 Tax=Prorocentrum cordatum TaxID=2364126 RepID=A0ABN9SKQ9_9DINO|nr:unnamed protein product [Polarella glacialis]